MNPQQQSEDKTAARFSHIESLRQTEKGLMRMNLVALLIGLAITLAIGMPAGLVQQQDARGIVVHGADASGASGASGANVNGVNGKNTGGVNGTNANGANGVNANGANGYLFFLVYLPNVLFF